MARYAHANTNLDNRVMTSLDGVNWSGGTTPTDTAVWITVAWSPELGLWAAFASGGGTSSLMRCMTSPDGVTWTVRTIGTIARTWRCVCWGGPAGAKRFVAVGSDAVNNNIALSSDGITWTQPTKPNTNALYGVCWSQELGLFVATCIGGAGNRVVTSPDGTTWTARTTPVDNNWQAVCWSKERALFVAVAVTGTGNRVMTSPDGINWTIRTSASDHNWASVCWSAEIGLFVATANAGSPTTSRIMTSPDGINWTTRTHPVGNATQTILWAKELGLFVGVANSGASDLARVITSPDGIAWTARLNAPNGPTWVGLGWNGSKLVAVAQANGINPELLTWPGMALKIGDNVRYGFTLNSGQCAYLYVNPGRNASGAMFTTAGFKSGNAAINADADAFGLYANTDVAADLQDFACYKQDPAGGNEPRGTYDYYLVPVDAAGRQGPSTKFANVVVM